MAQSKIVFEDKPPAGQKTETTRTEKTEIQLCPDWFSATIRRAPPDIIFKGVSLALTVSSCDKETERTEKTKRGRRGGVRVQERRKFREMKEGKEGQEEQELHHFVPRQSAPPPRQSAPRPRQSAPRPQLSLTYTKNHFGDASPASDIVDSVFIVKCAPTTLAELEAKCKLYKMNWADEVSDAED